MDISKLTIGEAREIAAIVNGNQSSSMEHPYRIGKPYLIRTVTHINTGILKAVGPQELVLTDACWIANTGRFSEQWNKDSASIFDEVEPWPAGEEVVIGRGAIIDATEISAIPTSKK